MADASVRVARETDAPAVGLVQAEVWREADPARRFWQVTSHRLQVTVPAINTSPLVSRSA